MGKIENKPLLKLVTEPAQSVKNVYCAAWGPEFEHPSLTEKPVWQPGLVFAL